MGQAKDKLRVFENVMARVGLAGDFLGEYFKALSSINGLNTFNEVNPPMPPATSNNAISTPQTPNPTPTTTPPPIVP